MWNNAGVLGGGIGGQAKQEVEVGELRGSSEALPLLPSIMTPTRKTEAFLLNKWIKMGIGGLCGRMEPKMNLPTSVPLIVTKGSHLPPFPLLLSPSLSSFSSFFLLRIIRVAQTWDPWPVNQSRNGCSWWTGVGWFRCVAYFQEACMCVVCILYHHHLPSY